MATKKRQTRKLSRVTAERLEELRTESSLTVAEFAKRCQLPGKQIPAHTTFVAWRSGGSIPGGEYLRQIAVEFGVTTDWLLGIAGAAKHANQARSDSSLETDLAGAVERELRNRIPPTVPGAREPYVWRVLGSAALESAIHSLEIDAHQALERQRARTAFLVDVDSLNRAVSPITDRLEKGQEISDREATVAQHLLSVSRRILDRVEIPVAEGPGARVMLFPESQVAESA